ncbi:phosphoinositide phosphatase [Grosmannia clavigera kw1407]|uniref:Phosphoinositide phosphatase n=1 Tax=Grosmannia clavigera (strain kw1407 / UAMH 11150) TaxID=655863 RepID=F0XU31_GROCL|nr:phosphoinositide phosphatase [Grosmannia clavigera kw1407]EFW98939.1 phosphoinositide phosphatase [Grosmannia clavigera kw1407]
MAFPFRDINVQVSADSYIFKSPSSPDALALTIDRPTGEVRLDDAALLSGKRASRIFSIKGILGMIQLRLDKYVIVITKDEPVGRLKGHMVHRIAAVDFLPVHERQVRDPDEDRFLSLLRGFLRSGRMHYSYTLDLTNSFQRQAAQQDAAAMTAGGQELPLWMRADDRFFWNRFVQSDLIDFRRKGARGQPGPQAGADPYILAVVFGVLEIKPTTFRGRPLTLALLTRRSRFRGGTRFFSRGMDAEGHVANYNETELVVVLNDSGGSSMGGFSSGGGSNSGGGSTADETQILSYVQTRGSVPTFWGEINNLKYTPKLEVRSDARGIEAAVPAATAHFGEQVRLYGDNYLVNLVNQKGREQRVKEAYERLVRGMAATPGTAQSVAAHVHYIYFDFHAETKGMRLERAALLLDRMQEALVAQQYFRAADMPASARLEVRSLQTSMVRTNCMDCLDRTNVVQTMLARWTLERMFADVGLMPRRSDKNAGVGSSSTLQAQDPEFELLFRNLWSDNADLVAASYAGTGAMKTDMTRLGRRTKRGALRDGQIAVTRYCLNNFFDGPRQDAFDLFLGSYLPGEAAVGPSLVFADRRPVLIQAVPYVFAFSVFFLLVGLFTRRMPDSAVLPLRLFLLFWGVVAAYSGHFMLRTGELYVNWPKLIPRPSSVEDYREAMNKARKDKLLGALVTRHERGLSTARYSSAEEGKKRIE